MMRKSVLLTFAGLFLVFGCATKLSEPSPTPEPVPEPVTLEPPIETVMSEPTPPAIPATLIDEILFGGDDVRDFQFFVSGTITLRRTDVSSDNNIADDEEVIDEIVISVSTPGMFAPGISLPDLQEMGDRLELPIVFGDNDGYLFFGIYENGDGKYKLLFHRRSQVVYGNEWYSVIYDGGEIPYLLVKKPEGL